MIDGPPEGMRGEKTSPEVRVTDEPREPVRDPSLGIEGEVAAEGTPRHRLVAIGGSPSDVRLIGWIDQTLDGVIGRTLL